MRKRDDFVLFVLRSILKILHRKLQTYFHGRGAIVRKKHICQFRVHPFAEPDCEFFSGIVCEASDYDVLELDCLFRNGGSNARIGVAVEIYPPRRNRIDNLASIGSEQVRAFRVGYAERRRIEQFVTERVPDAQLRAHCAKAERSK
jgi:hypothetical protein